MNYTDPLYTTGMTEHQRAWFYAEYSHARRDEIVGVLLAIFLGGFGLHHFYLRRYGLGVIYLLFGWTGIPILLGFIEAFFMPGRVRGYNAMQAASISGQIRANGVAEGEPPTASLCMSCSAPLAPGAGFCPRCGAVIASRNPGSWL